MKFNVLNMNCNHCAQKVNVALLKNGITAKIDLANKELEIPGKVDPEMVIRILDEIGYKAELK